MSTETGNDKVIAILKKYADSVTEQTLRTCFGDISSLNELSNILESKSTRFDDFFKASSYSNLKEDVKAQLQIQRSLDGVMLTINRPFREQEDVIHIQHKDLSICGRDPPILVMGGSGSGKTMFSYDLLRKILKGKTFYVYMHAMTAFDGRKKKNAREVGKHMHTKIDEAITAHGGTDAMELTLIVIVDEVGVRKDHKYVGEISNLQQIEKELHGLAKKVRLVLSGTGLDQITTCINSDQQSIKIRLKPWKKDKVKQFIEIRGYANPSDFVELIWSTPLYKNLASNPRALSHLVETLQEQQEIYGNDMISSDFVVSSVANRYIKANSLATLLASEKRLVAMFVWKALADAGYQSREKINLCPEGEYENLDKIEACCHSLIDINLESESGDLKLIEGEDYAISITSAISIVLFALTGNVASLCRNWEEFETVAALHELQLAYIASYPKQPPPIKIVVSRTLFPGKEQNFLRVPKVNQYTILINGPKADYADVISSNRLVQAKHQENGGCYKLNLQKELSKMGVTRKENNDKNNRTTNLLRKLWSGYNLENKEPRKKPKPSEPAPVTETDTVSLALGCTRHGTAVSKLTQCPNKSPFPHYSILMGEPASRCHGNLSVVFVTNANKFMIPKKGSGIGTDTYLERMHVDKNGELVSDTFKNSVNQELKKYFKENLLDGVTVHFFFLEQDGKVNR